MNRCIITVLLLLIGAPVWAVNPARYFGKSYAVVIGIRNYQNANHWKELKYAEKDAEAMAELLRKQGFEVQLFIGREATKNNIVAYLEDDLATQLTMDDRIVFYFSGHGGTRLLVGGRDRGYIIPYDGSSIDRSSTWISMEKLQELANKLGNARHQLFIFDSCFGGLFATKGPLNSMPEDTPNYIAEVASHRARQYLTAGGAKERTPADSQLYGYREHSHYTAYLLKGLEGAADTYRDGVITASELDAYLGPAAKSNYNTPCGGNFAGHEQGNFVFSSLEPAVEKRDATFMSKTKGNQLSNSESMHNKALVDRAFRLRLRGADELTPYDEADSRLAFESTTVLTEDKKRPLDTVELDSPNVQVKFLSNGNMYRSGTAFAPPKTIDCSKLTLKPYAFTDAIEAGASIVRINAPRQTMQIVVMEDVKKRTKLVKIKPVYGGVLALCNISGRATGPDSRSYRIRGLDDYFIKGRDGLISVVGALLEYGREPSDQVNSDDYSWMLWLTDRKTTFTNYKAEMSRRKRKATKKNGQTTRR